MHSNSTWDSVPLSQPLATKHESTTHNSLQKYSIMLKMSNLMLTIPPSRLESGYPLPIHHHPWHWSISIIITLACQLSPSKFLNLNVVSRNCCSIWPCMHEIHTLAEMLKADVPSQWESCPAWRASRYSGRNDDSRRTRDKLTTVMDEPQTARDVSSVIRNTALAHQL